jgi:protein SCO1/2
MPDDGLWPFLLPAPGHEKDVERLAESVGFRYKYDPKSRQFAHSAVVVVLTPAGKVSRYLYDVKYKPRDLRFALVEASGGRVGTTLDRVLLTCFKYDPMTQGYTPYAFGFVRIGALLSAAALATLLAILWRREWLNRRRRPA